MCTYYRKRAATHSRVCYPLFLEGDLLIPALSGAWVSRSFTNDATDSRCPTRLSVSFTPSFVQSHIKDLFFKQTKESEGRWALPSCLFGKPNKEKKILGLKTFDFYFRRPSYGDEDIDVKNKGGTQRTNTRFLTQHLVIMSTAEEIVVH